MLRWLRKKRPTDDFLRIPPGINVQTGERFATSIKVGDEVIRLGEKVGRFRVVDIINGTAIAERLRVAGGRAHTGGSCETQKK